MYSLSANVTCPFDSTMRDGRLMIVNPINYEDGITTYELSATVSDISLTSAAETIQVTINDMPEDPVIQSGQVFTFAENQNGIISVGLVNASDPDGGDLQLTILNGALGEDGVTPDFEVQGNLEITCTANNKVNYEKKNAYDLSIKVTDNTNRETTSNVRINVQDVNDVPVATSLFLSISKHEPNQVPTCTKENYCLPGSNVGNLVGSDEDGDSLTWHVVQGDPTFSVSPQGLITVATISPTLQTMDGNFTLIVNAADGRGGTSQNVSIVINVVDVNYAPIFTTQSFDVRENDVAAAIGNLTASDDTSPAFQDLRFSIIRSNPSGYASQVLIGTGSENGQLKLANGFSLDYENIRGDGIPAGELHLTVACTDSKNAFTEANVVVRVEDVNEAPVFSSPLLSMSVEENGAKSITLTAIYDGKSSQPKGVEVYISDPGDYTQWTIKTNTNGGSSWSTAYTFGSSEVAGFKYITAHDSLLTGWGLSNVVQDGSFTFNGDDAVAIAAPGGDVFDVYGVFQEDGTGMAWEYVDSYSVRKSGTTASAVWTAADWTVKGIDYLDGVSDQQAELTAAFGSFTPTSSSSSSAQIAANFYASDLDASDQGNLVYTIVNPESYPFKIVTDGSCAAASGKGGVCFAVHTDGKIDYENMPASTTGKKYVFQVKVRDSATPTRNEASVQVEVQVVNVNEPPIVVSTQSASALESVNVGSAVLSSISAMDPENLPLTISITSGNDDGVFEISNQALGTVSVAKVGSWRVDGVVEGVRDARQRALLLERSAYVHTYCTCH